MKSPFQLPVIRRALADSPLVVIDVGAKGGVVAPWSHPGVGSLVRTYGFEPNPKDFAELKSTPECTYYQMAISDQPGRASLHARSGVGSLLQRKDREWHGETFEQVEVEVDTLSNLARKGLIARPDVIKTDIERYDLRAVRGADELLDDVLAVMCEFEFYNTDHDNSFSSIDRLLTGRGMMLFGLTLKSGSLGELSGGDLLYVRDVGTLLSRDLAQSEKRTQFLKLFAIAVILRNMRYAAILCAAARRSHLLDDAEYSELEAFLATSVYLPYAVPGGAKRLRGRIAHMLSFLGQLVVGSNIGVKSAPYANTFVSYRHAFVHPRWLPRALRRRHRAIVDRYVEAHAALEGIYYAPIAAPAQKDAGQPSSTAVETSRQAGKADH